MNTARTSRTRVATVFVATISMLLTFAIPAFASDVDLEQVSAVCEDGTAVGLQYTARLVDRIDETTSATARIDYKPAGLDNDAYSTIDTLVLDGSNGYQASGTSVGLDFGGDTRATVRVTITESDNPAVTRDSYVQSVDLTECQPGPGGPYATFTVCGDNSPAALLGNTGESPVEYRVVATTGTETFETTTTVQPNRPNLQRVPLVFAGLDSLEGRTIDLTVYVGDRVELVESFVVECENPEPSATISGECTSTGGSISVTVDNPTDAPVEYVVTVNGEEADRFSVASGSETRDYDVADGDYDVVVTADGETVASDALEIDCTGDASATAVGSCLDTGVIEVDLTNPDATTSTFVITIDGVVVDSVDVTDGIETRTYPAAVGDREVVITADGEVVLDTVIDVDCNDEVLNVIFEVGCDEQTGLGTFQATLTNDGPATTAQVLVDGEIVADVDVDANSVANFAVELPNGLSQVVVVSNGRTISTAPIEVDCAQPVEPDPIVTHECQTPLNGSYTVTVENPSDVETREVVVTMTNAAGSVVVDETTSIAPGASITVNAPVDNGTYVLNVASDGTELLNESVSVQCTEVLGVSLTNNPQQQLPAAGAATVAWVLLSMLLMFFGADVLLSGELRRRLAMMHG